MPLTLCIQAPTAVLCQWWHLHQIGTACGAAGRFVMSHLHDPPQLIHACISIFSLFVSCACCRLTHSRLLFHDVDCSLSLWFVVELGILLDLLLFASMVVNVAQALLCMIHLTGQAEPSCKVIRNLFSLLQDYILPTEYVNTMRDYMLDKCPVSTYKDIAEVIEEDLGKKPEELFASIEEVPLASASLAQVYTQCAFTN